MKEIFVMRLIICILSLYIGLLLGRIRVLKRYFRGHYCLLDWIPCHERLPEKNQKVIYCDWDGRVGLAYYTDKYTFWDGCIEFYDVIAWIPLPASYQKGVEN